MRKLGLHVPLEAERGYHLHLTSPSALQRQPLMMARAKFGVTPMATGLRCAGTVELGTRSHRPHARPLPRSGARSAASLRT